MRKDGLSNQLIVSYCTIVFCANLARAPPSFNIPQSISFGINYVLYKYGWKGVGLYLCDSSFNSILLTEFYIYFSGMHMIYHMKTERFYRNKNMRQQPKGSS